MFRRQRHSKAGGHRLILPLFVLFLAKTAKNWYNNLHIKSPGNAKRKEREK
jgi:hypothetical protein